MEEKRKARKKKTVLVEEESDLEDEMDLLMIELPDLFSRSFPFRGGGF